MSPGFQLQQGRRFANSGLMLDARTFIGGRSLVLELWCRNAVITALRCLLPGRTVISDTWKRRLYGKVRRALVDLLGPLREASGYSLPTAVGLALGFAREVTVASTFGLSSQLDVFIAIMTIQLFFGTQIGNALETVFIARVATEGGVVTVKREVKHRTVRSVARESRCRAVSVGQRRILVA